MGEQTLDKELRTHCGWIVNHVPGEPCPHCGDNGIEIQEPEDLAQKHDAGRDYTDRVEAAEELSQAVLTVQEAMTSDGHLLAEVTHIERVGQSVKVRFKTRLGEVGTHRFREALEPWDDDSMFARWVRANDGTVGTLGELIGEDVPTHNGERLVIPDDTTGQETGKEVDRSDEPEAVSFGQVVFEVAWKVVAGVVAAITLTPRLLTMMQPAMELTPLVLIPIGLLVAVVSTAIFVTVAVFVAPLRLIGK